MNRIAMPSLSRRDRRALIMGLVVVAPALVFVLVGKPYMSAVSELRQQADAQRALLERELDVLARGPSFPREVELASQRVARAEARLVRSADEPVAEAELTRYFEDLAARSRVLLQEMRSVALGRGVKPPAGTHVLRMTVTGESDLNGVAKFVQGIENGPLLLDITELSIEPRPPQRAQGGRGRGNAPPPQEGVLQFRIIVQAFAPAPAEEIVP